MLKLRLLRHCPFVSVVRNLGRKEEPENLGNWEVFLASWQTAKNPLTPLPNLLTLSIFQFPLWSNRGFRYRLVSVLLPTVSVFLKASVVATSEYTPTVVQLLWHCSCTGGNYSGPVSQSGNKVTWWFAQTELLDFGLKPLAWMYPLMAFSNMITRCKPKDSHRAVCVTLGDEIWCVFATGKLSCSSAGSAAFESQTIFSFRG